MRYVSALLLLVAVVISGVQASANPVEMRPNGVLIERADGATYFVHDRDDAGLWQVAYGRSGLWVDLVAVNPQLSDPDRIYPGQEISIPESLVWFFRLVAQSHNTSGSQSLIGAAPDTVVVPAAEVAHRLPMWAMAALVALGIAAIVLLLCFQGARSTAEQRLETIREQRQKEEERRKTEGQRRVADPYSGPPVVEGGLPTVESADQFFTEQYRAERRAMTVAESEKLPSVAIVRIIPVDVRGRMRIRYKDNPEHEFRNLPNWTPAWQCFFSDGTFRLSLMICGNDVRHGEGMVALPETQIRPRQDGTPSFTPETPRQVWPVVTEMPAPEPEPAKPEPKADVPVFVWVKVTGPRRYVLHPKSGQEIIIDLNLIPEVTIGIENGDIFIQIGTARRVIGRLIEEPAEEKPGDC